MTFFGETLRKAREAKGLTTSQVADRTHILVQIIEAMEREDFKRIPAAIYGRGFVRHISEVLEIDPKPLVSEFMEIYEGRKPPATDPFQPKPTASYSIPPVAATNLPPTPVSPTDDTNLPPTPVSPTADTPPPVVQDLDLFNQTPAPAPTVESNSSRTLWTGNDVQPVIAPEPQTPNPEPQTPNFELPTPNPEPQIPSPVPSPSRAQDIFSTAYGNAEEDIKLGPSAAEKFRESLSTVSHGVIGGVRRIPRSAWRMAVLVIGAVVVIGLIVWGCSVLYRITEVPAENDRSATTITTGEKPLAATAAKPATPAAKPGAPVKLRSTGQKVPPLYVD